MLIIILAVVAISFAGLLVYGASRGDQPTAKNKQGCPTFPKGFTANNEPDEDDLDDWCPPGIAEATTSLQARFAPDLGIDPVELKSSSGLIEARSPVGQSDKKVRSAHIELIDGTAAILTDGHKAKLCLCKPDLPVSPLLLDDGVCPDRWRTKHLRKAKPGEAPVCQAEDVSGILPFKEAGGEIVISSKPDATVRIH